ncbi:MAG: alkaline phosphatase family protein, partial [Armatimonadetes bacterium]|nr:alkaline phosphatase family protein [Armatimonadota bacterium]
MPSRSHAERSARIRASTWLTSVFPSITSTAMTSIYQGLPPSRHGILGHQIWK